MAKKLEGGVLSKRLSVAIVLLAIYSLLMIFMPAVAIKESTNSFTGLQVVFGYSVIQDLGILGGTQIWEDLGFSFFNLLPYIFVLAALVLMALRKFGVVSKWFTLIAVLLFILAAVFFFLQVSFCVPLKNMPEQTIEKFALGNGSLLATISSALAGLLLLGKSIIKE